MERTRWPGLAGLTLAVLAFSVPTASAKIAGTDVPLTSSNVDVKMTLPVGKPVGARFRDNYMFVTGTEGVSVYDISNPELPTPAGFLPLPHFENEDVDLGGDNLLVSNDPSEGVGVLYVVDISDYAAGSTAPVPTLRLKGALANGTIGDAGILAAIGAPTTSPLPVGTGHTVSCVNPKCTYAYMAGTADGITIVDLTDPASPKVVKQFKPDITGLTTHDVQIDDTGLAWIVGADGTEAYDVSDPVNPKAVMRTDENIVNSGQLGFDKVTVPDEVPFFGGFSIGGNGENPIDLIHHDSLRLGTVAKPVTVTGPPPSSQQVTKSSEGQEGLPGTVIAPGSTGAPRSGESGSSKSARGSAPATKKRRRAAVRRCRTARERRSRRCREAAKKKAQAKKHKKSKAKTKTKTKAHARAAAARKVQGLQLEPFKQVPGKTYPAGGDSPILGIVEEDYNRPTCQGAGEFQLWGITDEKTSKGLPKLGLLDRYQTELNKLVTDQSGWAPVTGLCSAHYFDYRDGIVAGGWYEEGTRFLDVRDPLNIKQVGYWVPTKGETWSVVFAPTDPTGQTVYALDYARGIDVLHIDRGDLKARSAPVRRSWLTGVHGPKDGHTSLTGLSQRSRYGYICRLPAAP